MPDLQTNGSPGHLGLTRALEEWDRSQITDDLQRAADERAAFVDRFPAEAWQTLPLERYALGVPDSADGYSRWLEFNTPYLGSIKGGSARKHLIFKQLQRDGWYFESKYSSLDEAWSAIREGFVSLLRLAAEGKFDEIDNIESLYAAPAARAKTTWIYFPDKLLPIYSTDHLDYWLKIFNVDAPKDVGTVGKNRRLFESVTAMPEFGSWQPLEIMYFLYSWSGPDRSKAILKIAPGAQAALWDDCRTNGYIRVGWDELGDLTQYESNEELRARYVELWPDASKSQATKDARSLRWLADLAPGDIVVANRGTQAVVGLGSVVDGYSFRSDLTDHRHTVAVKWFDTTERAVDFGSAWMPTVVRVQPEQYHQILHGRSNGPEQLDVPLAPVPALHRAAEELLERSGQVIFYGPPGTGKTYAARRHAVWLLLGGSTTPGAAQAFGPGLADLERRLSDPTSVDKRPSWLLVANPQRWRWQQLLDEGETDYQYGNVQRNYEQVLPGDTVFGYEAAPTKRIVATARVSRGLIPGDTASGIRIGGGTLVTNGPTWDVMSDDPVLGQSEPLRNRMQGTLFKLEPAEAARLRELCGDVNDGRPPPQVAQLTRVTFHPTYAYEDFIEGYKPNESGRGGLELQMRDGVFKRVCRAAAADPGRPYVVLIDEINRGNVPKIFGELITLIEKDKRGVSVSLPQSGKQFLVPPNVRIIATMNTADRSIHVLDAALRRRFAFLELLPDPGVLEGATIGMLPLDLFLDGLNALIRQHIGREKQVGHAVLMNGDKPIVSPKEFALAFRYELLPLLQEYTYGDYRDLALLLGNEVIDTAAETPRCEVLEEPELLVNALATHFGLG